MSAQVLRGLFPDLDLEVIEDVLALEQGDTAAAIDRLLEMSAHGQSASSRMGRSIAEQIADDAALAMVLSEEEAPPSAEDRGLRGEREEGALMSAQSLLDMSWTFARSLGAEEEDEPLGMDDERVIKGAAGARVDARSRGPCAVGLHRRQPWDPAAVPFD